MKNGVKATYIALFATSFATVRSSYNTGAAALLTYISEVKLCARSPVNLTLKRRAKAQTKR